MDPRDTPPPDDLRKRKRRHTLEPQPRRLRFTEVELPWLDNFVGPAIPRAYDA